MVGNTDISYVENDSTATLAPNPVFTAFEQTPLQLAADNIYNPFGVAIDDVRRRLLEFPERNQHNSSEVTRFSAALEGLFADWNWELAYSWSRSEVREETRNLVDATRLQRGIGPAAGCRGPSVDGCVPIDLLGPAGSIDRQQADFLRASGRVSGYFRLSGISVYLSRALLQLPYGCGDIAFGFEHRREATSKRPEGLLATTPTIGASNFDATSGSREISEIYTETILSAWKSPDGFLELDLAAALRYSTYSDFGESIDPRVGLSLRAGPALMFRTSYAEGFRAPSLNALYAGQTEDQAFLRDPCQDTANAGALPGFAQQADASRNQFLTLRGGNPDLDPETSRILRLGVVLTPRRLPGLSLSLDLFDISQRDVVAASAQFIVDQNAVNDRFANRVQRDAAGNLVLVQANNLKVGNRDLRGLDTALNYQRDSGCGKFTVSGSAAFIDGCEASLDSGSKRIDLAGQFRDPASEGLGGIPQWKAQLGIHWSHSRWQGNYQLHFVDAMREPVPGTDCSREIDAWLVHDLQLSYNSRCSTGCGGHWGWTTCWTNRRPWSPPPSTSIKTVDGRTHELKGRYWYTKLSQRY